MPQRKKTSRSFVHSSTVRGKEPRALEGHCWQKGGGARLRERKGRQKMTAVSSRQRHGKSSWPTSQFCLGLAWGHSSVPHRVTFVVKCLKSVKG